MNKFFTMMGSPLDDQAIDAITAVGGRLLDDHGSVGFDSQTSIVAIPNNHAHIGAFKKALPKNFLTFETTSSLFVLFRKPSHESSNLEPFLKRGLSDIRLDLCDRDLPAQSGRFVLPQVGELNANFPAFLDVVDAITGAVVEALFHYRVLGDFEFTVGGLAKRKKSMLMGFAPSVFIAHSLRHSDSGDVFVSLKVVIRTGNALELVSLVVTNAIAQDARELAKELRRVAACTVDSKALSEFMPLLLKQEFMRLGQPQIWVQQDGWIKNESGAITGFAFENDMILAPHVDRLRYFVDIKNPSFTVKGTLEGWNQKVLRPISNSFILGGMMLIGLAAMMVDMVPSLSSGIFNFYGLAGNGKSLGLAVVASLFGNTAGPGQSQVGRHGRALIETFGSTALALQAQGQRSKLGLMLIDEVGSNNFNAMDKFIYTTANGSARTRANSKGGIEESISKTLFLITTGEVSLLSLVGRNAKDGIFDRAADINVGEVPFLEEEVEHFRLMQSYEHQDELIAGVKEQYGTAAPAFARVLLSEMENNEWHEELEDFKRRLAANLPAYAVRGGASRVLNRFALAGVAGQIALRGGVFDSSIVDDEYLFNSIWVCACLWVRTRWGHLTLLADAISGKGRIPVSSPKYQSDIYRHADTADGLPTFMVSKAWLEELFPSVGEVERIAKRFSDDGQLFRHDKKRHTVGQFPYYHLRSDWLNDYDLAWCEEEEAFVRRE